VEKAGAEVVDSIRDDLGVQRNPRFEPADGDSGVVDLLGGEDPAAG
jgi:hypothetical protein